jgi:hypothetical protein
MENKTDILQHDLKLEDISFLPKYIKSISSGVLLHEFTYANRAL